MKCTHCNKNIPDTAKVCGYCGTKVEKPVKPLCSNCGEELTATAKVCDYCGTPLVKPAPSKDAPKKAAPAKKARAKVEKPKPSPAKKVSVKKAPAKAAGAKITKLPKWVLPVGLAAFALVLVLFFVFGSSPQEGSTGTDDFDALAGKWSGSAHGGSESFNITFNLEEGCSLYMVCGTFSIPQWGCSGDISFINLDGDKYEFRVSSMSGCEGDKAYEEWLRPINPSMLEYYSQGDFGVSQGTLTKQ